MKTITPGCDSDDWLDQTVYKAQKSDLMTEEKQFTLINVMQGRAVYILRKPERRLIIFLDLNDTFLRYQERRQKE